MLRRNVAASVAIVVGLIGAIGPTATASASTVRATTQRCPAPGETIDDATSTAPPRHTTEELATIRKQIEAELLGSTRAPKLMSIGDGRDTVEIGLAPGSEPIAASIVQQFGDAVRIDVGTVRYVPRGCGTAPAPQRCADLEGDAPSTAGVRLKVVVDRPSIRVSESGQARLEVHNVGSTDFSIDSGIPISGSLVTPGTRHVVGQNSFAMSGVGGGVHLAPGETGAIAVSFGAGRCDGRRGSALPPGRYGLRVVLTPEGPAGADLSPRLLSPQTLVTVTR